MIAKLALDRSHKGIGERARSERAKESGGRRKERIYMTAWTGLEVSWIWWPVQFQSLGSLVLYDAAQQKKPTHYFLQRAGPQSGGVWNGLVGGKEGLKLRHPIY